MMRNEVEKEVDLVTDSQIIARCFDCRVSRGKDWVSEIPGKRSEMLAEVVSTIQLTNY